MIAAVATTLVVLAVSGVVGVTLLGVSAAYPMVLLGALSLATGAICGVIGSRLERPGAVLVTGGVGEAVTAISFVAAGWVHGAVTPYHVGVLGTGTGWQLVLPEELTLPLALVSMVLGFLIGHGLGWAIDSALREDRDDREDVA